MGLSVIYTAEGLDFTLDLSPEAVAVMAFLAQSGHGQIIETAQ